MDLFRVEKNQQGPYTVGKVMTDNDKWLKYLLLIAHDNDPLRPSIKKDMVKHQTKYKEFSCGFISVAQLRFWFRGFLVRLEECGYHISIYSCDQRHTVKSKSGSQIFFRKGQSTSVGRIPLRLSKRLAIA